MAYIGSNFTNTMQRAGGGRQALRNLRTGGQQGRSAMSRYTGPNARPPGQQRGGRQNIRQMLSQQPNQNAYDKANPNARFKRGPQYAGPAIGGGSDLNSPLPNPPGTPPTLLGPGTAPLREPGLNPTEYQPPTLGGGTGYTLPPGTGPGPMTYTPDDGISHQPVDNFIPQRPMPVDNTTPEEWEQYWKDNPPVGGQPTRRPGAVDVPPPAGNPYTDLPLPPAPLPQRPAPPRWGNAQGGYRQMNPNDNPNARFNRGGGRDRIRQMMQKFKGTAPLRQPIGEGGSGQPIYGTPPPGMTHQPPQEYYERMQAAMSNPGYRADARADMQRQLDQRRGTAPLRQPQMPGITPQPKPIEGPYVPGRGFPGGPPIPGNTLPGGWLPPTGLPSRIPMPGITPQPTPPKFRSGYGLPPGTSGLY